jgi:hypothetical protein
MPLLHREILYTQKSHIVWWLRKAQRLKLTKSINYNVSRYCRQNLFTGLWMLTDTVDDLHSGAHRQEPTFYVPIFHLQTYKL